MEIIKPNEFQAWKDKQILPNDPSGTAYGMACFTYAERWADMMESALKADPSTDFAELANRTSHEADVEGITGFMYGVAVKILFDHWVYGDRLRRWHNSKYGASGAKANQTDDGVINPAILTF